MSLDVKSFINFDKDGTIRTIDYQDPSKALEYAKFARDQVTKSSRMGDNHHLFRCPTNLIEKWISEGRLPKNIYGKEAQIKLLHLVKTEAPQFMCTTKKV